MYDLIEDGEKHLSNNYNFRQLNPKRFSFQNINFNSERQIIEFLKIIFPFVCNKVTTNMEEQVSSKNKFIKIMEGNKKTSLFLRVL